MEKQLFERKHLRSDVESILEQPIEARIQYLERDTYIPYEIGDLLLSKMEYHLRREKSGRPLGMLISSPSGNGKTTLLQTFLTNHPVISTEQVEIRPVVLLQAPPSPTEKRFLGEIVKAFGLKDFDTGPSEARMKRVQHLVETCKVRVFLIDEIHNLLSGSPRQLEEACNLIKYLANELGIPIVLAGTRRAEHVVNSDDQLESRFPIFNLPLWKDGESFRKFLTYLESTLPLPKASNLSSDEKANYLLDKSDGVLGHMVRIVKNAAYAAIIEEQSAITTERLQRTSLNGLSRDKL